MKYTLSILLFFCLGTLLAQPNGKFGGGNSDGFACTAINNASLLELSIALDIKTFLQGTYNTTDNLMNDDLRTAGLLPLTEPYTALGYTHVGGSGGESISTALLDITGADALVDWVLIELRSAADNSVVLATRAALLQRDGDVVDTDGKSAVRFAIAAGNYYVAVRHRNHLGIMTLGTVVVN